MHDAVFVLPNRAARNLTTKARDSLSAFFLMKSFILILLQASVITKEHLQTPSGSQGQGGKGKYLPHSLLYKKIFQQTPGKYWINVENYGVWKKFLIKNYIKFIYFSPSISSLDVIIS